MYCLVLHVGIYSHCARKIDYTSLVYFLDTSVLLENTALVKFIQTLPGLEWRIFYILTSEDNDYFTDSLVYDRNIFECSWKVFGNLRNFYGKCSGTFVCHSEIFGKWSEILGKSPNQHVYIINSLAFGFYAGNLN